MGDFSSRPSRPLPSETDAATATRLQVENLFVNFGLTVHPTKSVVIDTQILSALPLMCPQPRRRLLAAFSGALPHTPSANVLLQRRSNCLRYLKDGVRPLTVLDVRLNSQRRSQHHERDRAHGPRGQRCGQRRRARALHCCCFPVYRRPARGRLSVRNASPLVLVRCSARFAGGRRVRHAPWTQSRASRRGHGVGMSAFVWAKSGDITAENVRSLRGTRAGGSPRRLQATRAMPGLSRKLLS